MNRKIIDVLFFLICFSLIFNNIPKPLQMNFIGGPVGSKLVVYPLLAGLAYTAYCQWKHGNAFVDYRPFLKYVCVYFAVVIASLILGLINYPYWQQVLSGPVEQIEKLPRVLTFLQAHGIEADTKLLMSAWMSVRQIKGVFLEIIWCFGGAYMIYCWYCNDWHKGLKIMCSAILASIGIITGYCLIELLYLAGNYTAQEILENINPYIHTIKVDGKWWPPLLWKGQLRSLFAEPSYFGIYMAFAMPFLWYGAVQSKKKVYFLATALMSFFLFLTKARTGFMLHIGILLLLICGFLIYLRKTKYLKKGFYIALCSFTVFVGSNFFINGFMNPSEKTSTKNELTNTITSYVDDNALSLANPDRRSNRARYSIMEADFKIGLDNFALGVGKGLRDAYIPDYLSQAGKNNNEIKMWMDFQKKLGVLKSGIPRLGEYTSRFAETGIVGVIIFLLPMIGMITQFIKRLPKLTSEDALAYIIILVSAGGTIASGIGDTLNIAYCYWVLLGLGYAMCFRKKNEVVDNERA